MNPHTRHSYINDRFYNHADKNSAFKFNHPPCPHCESERFYQHQSDLRDPWTQRESRSRDGLHAGKGPKFYRRSDERILEEANEALTHDAFVDASEILVKVEKAVLTLSGTVMDRLTKKAAERCVEDIFGVSDIKNLIEIVPTENQQ